MEARVAVLENKVDALDGRADKHDAEDASIHKYMTNMMENLQARLAGIERTGARFEADLLSRANGEKSTKEQLDSIYNRLHTVERAIWLATGGILAVGAVATFFGWSILKELAR